MLRLQHVLTATLLLALVPAAQAQAEKHAELGLTFTCPSGYERLPVRPRERFGVLSFVQVESSGERRGTLDVYLVPRASGTGETVVDGRTFLAQVLVPKGQESERAGRARYGYEPRRWSLELNQEGVQVSGWAHAWEGPERSYVIVGRCAPDEYKAQRSLWVRSAENLRLFTPIGTGNERRRWERYYAGRRGLVGIEHRIQARVDLVSDWKVRDTEHFIVLSHQVNEGFVIDLTTAVESLRREFARICPPDGVLDQVSTVRICRDEAEYLAYGGWKGSVGYWSPSEQELVVFDARERGGEATPAELDGEHYTRAVLFHEAFHQYVHYAAEGIAPHPWFDEGMAEYFGGALVEGRSFRGIEPNRYRVETAKSLLGEVGSYPWEAVTAMEQAEFYGDPGRLYPQGWSMVHFLAASTEAKRDRQWSQILPTYFRTLRSAWALERRRLAGGGSYQDAQRRARTRARSEAFKDVDWTELEAAWRQHLSGLRRPSAR